MRIRHRVAVTVAVALAGFLAAAAGARAQVFELIDSFAGCPTTGCSVGSDARRPTGPLLLGPDGFFYGATGIDWRPGEEAGSWGAIFRIGTAGERVVLHRFSGDGPGNCSNGSLTIGNDGALYGVGARCPFQAGTATIFRLVGTSFTTLQEFPPGDFTPRSLFAGSGGAFYGVGTTATGRTVFYKWDGAVTVLAPYLWSPYQSLPEFLRAPDGSLYFPRAFDQGSEYPYGEVSRITSGDQIEVVHNFAGSRSPNPDLILGSDGRLHGTVSTGGLLTELYRMTLAGAVTYLGTSSGAGGAHPLAAGVEGSIFLAAGETITRRTPSGTLVPVHTFTGADGSGAMPRLTRGPDGHFYGVRSEGGAHGEGVFYRIRMPSVDVDANGGDGPISIAAGDPLEISLAFDAAPETTIDAAEVYVAVVTPSLQVFWMDASGGFTAAPTRLYAGPLSAFGAVPLLTIPDATPLPDGDYYWFAIVDADTNGVPNGTMIDFVKTTRGG